MNKMMEFLEKRVMPVANRIASMRYLRALMDGPCGDHAAW